MRRWLEAFTDEEIQTMARHVWNRRGGSVATVQAHRSRLGVPEPFGVTP
jgi:hypothetical protein